MLSKNDIKNVKKLELKKHRQREGLFVAEGPKVVGDLLAAGYAPKQLYATEEWLYAHSNGSFTAIAQLVSDEDLRRISFLQHPQQVLAVFPTKTPSPLCQQDLPSGKSKQQRRLILALDGIQDPGNLGTIIRIADWFGITQIVCSMDTADAWAPKVVQATMGSIARVEILYVDLVSFLSSAKLPICGTLLDGDDIYTNELPSEAIIVMGNEGNGISSQVRQLVTKRLLIPQFSPGAESLNVAIATAITCSEFRRRQ